MYELHPARSVRSLRVFLVIALLATAIDIGTFLMLGRVSLAQPARIAVALLPLPGNLALIVLALRAIRRLDEFQKRVHFEAVAVAFLSTGVAVFLYGFLQMAHAAGPLNTVIIWTFMCLSYAVGYFIAVRHYR